MVRSLRKNAKLYSVAVFSLAIAMALTVAALSLSNAFLLRPPLAREPERLVTIFSVAANGAQESLSYPDYQYFRDRSESLAELAAFNYGFYKSVIEREGRREMAQVDAVSDNYFQVMGIPPSQLMRLVFRETLAMAGAGLIAGLALGVAAGGLFRARFFGVERLEWHVLAPVAIGVLAAALAIAFAAARRFTRMNPMDAVRQR